MSEKKTFHGIAMDHMSVANHQEILKKALSPAGHAEAFKPLQQQQPQQPAQTQAPTPKPK